MNSLLTVRDVATLLRVSKGTVYRMVGERRLPFFKLGTGVRFRERDMDDFLDRYRRTTRAVEFKFLNELTNLLQSPIDKAKGGLTEPRII
jgi:excisionase family DNA binding protein